jgi:cytochrome P450
LSPSTAAYPPGPTAPLPWQLIRAGQDPIGYLTACAERFGDVFTVRTPRPLGPLVIASGPSEINQILTDTDRFEGGRMNPLMVPYTGQRSVIVISGQEHLRRRKLVLPTFHRDLVARWSDRIEAITQAELDSVPRGVPVRVREIARRVTVAVICRLIFGIDDPRQAERFCAVVGRWMDIRSIAVFIPALERRGGRLNPTARFVRLRTELRQLVVDQIASSRKRDRNGRDDVMSVLVAARDEDGHELTDTDLRDELLGLLLAGHATTSSGIAWTFELLSRHPEAQARLAAELATEERQYLGAVASESLRLRPPVIGALRVCRHDTELAGHRLPAGTSVSAMLAVAHRRADIWERPLEFRPERFLDGAAQPLAYLPFGRGIRYCVGAALAKLELRVALECALRRFRIVAVGGEEKGRLVSTALIPAKGGVVKLVER